MLTPEAGTTAIERARLADQLPILRRVAGLSAGSVILATAILSTPLWRAYSAAVWLPASFVYAITAASFLNLPETMANAEKTFWKALAFLGFYSSTTMLAFGVAGTMMGSLSSLSQQGRIPSAAWLTGVAVNGMLALAVIAYAMSLRAKIFFVEPHHPRLAALDVLSLGAALIAIDALLVLPRGKLELGWFAALALLQVGAWSAASVGAFINVLQRHAIFARSSQWIMWGSIANTVGTSLLMAQILQALERQPTGGSASAAFIMLLGALAFGEAFDADRKETCISKQKGPLRRDLYPSLEHESLRLKVLTEPTKQELKRVAGPLVSVAGPVALAIAIFLVLSERSGATVVHRTILYAGFVVSLTASVGKLLFDRFYESRAAYRFATLLLDEKALIDQVLVAVDKDRSVLAARIHDGLVQPMTASLLKISHARVMLERGDLVDGENLLKQGISALSENIAEARSLVTTVYPPSLEHLGLAAALKELVSAYRRQGVVVDAEWDWAGPLNPRIAVSMYRVANEALEDVLLHAEPKRASLRLRSLRDGLELVISDEGPGFVERPESEYIKEGRLGLATMRRVMDMIGASLEIEAVGRTTVRAWIPVEASSQSKN